MEYAHDLNGFLNAFHPEPLKPGEEMERFYYGETMPVRTGDPVASPIRMIAEGCKAPDRNSLFLLFGHRGCGKSTELNKMSEGLRAEGYRVRTVNCAADLDLLHVVYSDILILMGDELIRLAQEVGCELDRDTANNIMSFWDEKTEMGGTTKDFSFEEEIGAEVSTPEIFSKVLSFFARLKSGVKYSQEIRTEYKRKLDKRLGDWTAMLNALADQIAEKCSQHKPILILEDLDKLPQEELTWDIFLTHATALTGFTFPVIYTFPIALSYDPRFGDIENYYSTKLFSMIKVKTIEGERFDEGYKTIEEIVKKRADLALFEEGVLDYLIQKTGGSLRDLFTCIETAATRARWRKSSAISMEDAERALKEKKSMLTRRIDGEYYGFLVDIHTKHVEIGDKPKLLKMLQAGTVLEYNGERWHDLHPLIEEFMVEIGRIPRQEAQHGGEE